MCGKIFSFNKSYQSTWRQPWSDKTTMKNVVIIVKLVTQYLCMAVIELCLGLYIIDNKSHFANPTRCYQRCLLFKPVHSVFTIINTVGNIYSFLLHNINFFTIAYEKLFLPYCLKVPKQFVLIESVRTLFFMIMVNLILVFL